MQALSRYWDIMKVVSLLHNLIVKSALKTFEGLINNV
jgi:hypothetical protein